MFVVPPEGGIYRLNRMDYMAPTAFRRNYKRQL
jgi:hypothetical protein